MSGPLAYDSTKGPMNILGVMAVPTVVTVHIAAVGPGFRDPNDGRIPHLRYTTGMGIDARPIVAEGPSYDDPLAFHVDAGTTIALPYLGTLYVVGGAGHALVKIFSRRSQERNSPAWPMSPQPWSLSHATNGGQPIRFAVPTGAESLAIVGSSATVELRYDTAGEIYTVNNNDRVALTGVSFVVFTPSSRGMAIIRGWL